MNTQEKIILDTDNEAAQLKTVTVWVSRDGKMFNDESIARYWGCTHKTCECGNVMSKGWTKCDSCRGKNARERFKQFEFKEWDGVTPLCIFNDDTYFFDEDDIECYLENNELEPEDLSLVLCKPNHFSQISEDYWSDDMPEDGELPKELVEKLNSINEFIKILPPQSWSPSNIRTEYKRA